VNSEANARRITFVEQCFGSSGQVMKLVSCVCVLTKYVYTNNLITCKYWVKCYVLNSATEMFNWMSLMFSIYWGISTIVCDLCFVLIFF